LHGSLEFLEVKSVKDCAFLKFAKWQRVFSGDCCCLRRFCCGEFLSLCSKERFLVKTELKSVLSSHSISLKCIQLLRLVCTWLACPVLERRSEPVDL
jgi:hypothetical protein